LGEVEATLFEGREQVTAYSLVLGRALLEAEYVLVALVVDAKRGDHGEGRDLDAVGQQAHDVEIREVFGHQLLERDLGAGDETTGHRGSRRPTGIEAVAYRLEARRIATRREAPIIRSNAISDSSSSPENAFQLGSAISSPASERTRGLSTATRLPPSTTDDCSYY